MKRRPWSSVPAEVRAQMRETMVSQLRDRLDRILARAIDRQNPDRVARMRRALATAERLA